MDQTTADRKVRNALIGLSSRTQALFIYGATALGVSLAMLSSGVPGDLEVAMGPTVRLWLGLPLLVAGLLIISGSFVANERRWAWWSAVVGFVLFTIWATTMAVAYAGIGLERGVDWALPWTQIDPESGRMYIPVFYQGVSMLTGMHVVTFIRLGRPPVR